MITKAELTPEDLNAVNGGVIINATLTTGYRVCDDKTGNLISGALTQESAQELAREYGVSTEVISRAEYFNRYGFDGHDNI